jgi:hypothetical protein
MGINNKLKSINFSDTKEIIYLIRLYYIKILTIFRNAVIMCECVICQKNNKIVLKTVKKCKCKNCYRAKHPLKPELSEKKRGLLKIRTCKA